MNKIRFQPIYCCNAPAGNGDFDRVATVFF